MRYRQLITTTTAFLLVVLIGGVWVGMAQRFAPGHSALAVTLLGGVFSATFIWLLIARLRQLLLHPERRVLELGLLMLSLAALIFGFAWVHHQIGLMDVSGPAPRPTNDLGDALYFSVVTSTTLGYGDFIPLGPGRPLAAIQALTGYMILGILVSTGFQIIAPHTRPEEAREKQETETTKGKEEPGQIGPGESGARERGGERAS